MISKAEEEADRRPTPEPKRSLVVCLWGGPGTGKSTNASGVFYKLKLAGIETELVHEYAKDLTWEERHRALAHQPYIMAKQQYHIDRVMGKVDVILTDSPLPLGLIYQGPAYTHWLGNHIMETFRKWNTLNIFLERDRSEYSEVGRAQTLDEAIAVDRKIRELLLEQSIMSHTVEVQTGEATANAIVRIVEHHLMIEDEIEAQLAEDEHARRQFEG